MFTSNWAAPYWSDGDGRAPYSALYRKRWWSVSSVRKTPEVATWRPIEDLKKSSDAGPASAPNFCKNNDFPNCEIIVSCNK